MGKASTCELKSDAHKSRPCRCCGVLISVLNNDELPTDMNTHYLTERGKREIKRKVYQIEHQVTNKRQSVNL